jgi:hypothetical protein
MPTPLEAIEARYFVCLAVVFGKKNLSFSCGVHSVGSQRMFNDF